METIKTKSYILITGGSGGIGASLSKLLTKKKIFPIIGYNSNSKKAFALANELGTFAVKIDLFSEISINNAIKYITKQIQNNDKLIGAVFCASPSPDIFPFLQTKAEQLSKQFQVNVIGHQILIKALIKKFFQKEKIGTIVGVLSKAIGSEKEKVATSMSSYIIAKSALKSMLSVCAVEFNWLKVRTIIPSFTKTKMLDVFDPRYLEMLDSKQKISTPENVAKLIINEII